MHTTQLDEFQFIGVHLSMKEVSVLQEAQDGQRDVTAKIIEHPLEQEVTKSHKISENVKEPVKDITQEYEYFKLKISGYTLSS